ncbi:hypothetical protein ABZ863_19455 [Saccharomonospora sp. NPDC046836]|uniref:hypothetical protein n=1 Tax=Saccharomonospora sp. NPDC046836 TaxID=3156921 RepID=UPI0033EC9F2F
MGKRASSRRRRRSARTVVAGLAATALLCVLPAGFPVVERLLVGRAEVLAITLFFAAVSALFNGSAWALLAAAVLVAMAVLGHAAGQAAVSWWTVLVTFNLVATACALAFRRGRRQGVRRHDAEEVGRCRT